MKEILYNHDYIILIGPSKVFNDYFVGQDITTLSDDSVYKVIKDDSYNFKLEKKYDFV